MIDQETQNFIKKYIQETVSALEPGLNATLASEQGRWLLAGRTNAAAELAVSALDQGKIARHIVDLSFVEDGERWIIDYKTASVVGDESALRNHAERYRAQLERYAQLFADQGVPLRLAIFYATLGRLVELPVGNAAAVAPFQRNDLK